jgi:hypothetical protein
MMDSALKTLYQGLSESDRAKLISAMVLLSTPQEQPDQGLSPINAEKEVLDVSDEKDIDLPIPANPIKRCQLSKDRDHDGNDNSVRVSFLE